MESPLDAPGAQTSNGRARGDVFGQALRRTRNEGVRPCGCTAGIEWGLGCSADLALDASRRSYTAFERAVDATTLAPRERRSRRGAAAREQRGGGRGGEDGAPNEPRVLPRAYSNALAKKERKLGRGKGRDKSKERKERLTLGRGSP